MLFGVPTFSYTSYRNFADDLARDRVFYGNAGDNIQTIAVRRALRRVGVESDNIVAIDRDTLPAYRGPPVALVMNAVFPAHAFPLPPQVRPIFIGFSSDARTIGANRDALARWQPIGCRDDVTAEHVREAGIEAYTSGCLTFTFPPRPATDGADRVFVIFGSGAGALPNAVLAHLPQPLLERAELVFHRVPLYRHPADARERRQAELFANSVFERYRRSAALIITPLHHVAAPALASGIPVALVRNYVDGRFSFLSRHLPLLLPEDFAATDFAAIGAADVSGVRRSLLALLRREVEAALAAGAAVGRPANNPACNAGPRGVSAAAGHPSPTRVGVQGDFS